MRTVPIPRPVALAVWRGRLADVAAQLQQVVRQRSEVIAAGMLLVGMVWRLLLAGLHWPPTNSDEGFTGLIAMHIAFRGEHPIYFYGSSYEGPLDAYMAAGIFRVLGASLSSLRLTIVVVSTLAIGSIYLLTRRLYGRGLALATLALLAVSTPEALSQQIFARGGYVETLLFSAVSLLLAVELARGPRGGRVAPHSSGRRLKAVPEGRKTSKSASAQYPSYTARRTAMGSSPRRRASRPAGHVAAIFSRQAPRPARSQSGVWERFGASADSRGSQPLNNTGREAISRRPPQGTATRAMTQAATSTLVRVRKTDSPSRRGAMGARRGSVPARMPALRLAAYAALGLAAGLAIWAATLALPFILAACVLLVALRGRELLTRAGLCLVLGLLVGTSPLLIYAIGAPDHNPLSGAFAVQHSSNAYQSHVVALFTGEAVGTVVDSLPIITGGAALLPQNSQQAWPLSAHGGWPQLLAHAIHGGWGIGYLALLVVALLASVRRVRARWLVRRKGASQSEEDSALAIECGRLALLASAGLTVLLFAASPAAARDPQDIARYLLGLLIALGAVLEPLWQALRDSWARRRLLAWTALGVVAVAYVCGIADTIGEFHSAQAEWARQTALVSNLERLGATRIYSEYWTCGLVIFLSRERVICAALNGQLQPDLDRYPPYRATVDQAAHPAYVFPLGSPQAAAFAARAATTPGKYRQQQMDGYVVYEEAGT
jgi:hypothetical protein